MPLRRSIANVGRQRASAQVRLVAAAQPVQLVGVPADVENAVECFHVGESAEDPAHPGLDLVGRQRCRASVEDARRSVGGR